MCWDQICWSVSLTRLCFLEIPVTFSLSLLGGLPLVTPDPESASRKTELRNCFFYQHNKRWSWMLRIRREYFINKTCEALKQVRWHDVIKYDFLFFISSVLSFFKIFTALQFITHNILVSLKFHSELWKQQIDKKWSQTGIILFLSIIRQNISHLLYIHFLVIDNIKFFWLFIFRLEEQLDFCFWFWADQ